MNHRLADGVALSVEFSTDDTEALREYHENPIVFEMVNVYAREHNISIEEVLYGRSGIHVEAPKLGISVVGDAIRAQKILNRSLNRE